MEFICIVTIQGFIQGVGKGGYPPGGPPSNMSPPLPRDEAT